MEVPNPNPSNHPSNYKTKKKKNQSPEGKFRRDLDLCSKHKDLSAAISLYDSALSHHIRLTHHHFNALLYICSETLSDHSAKISAYEFGFRVFNHMLASGIKPTEATVTAVARISASKGDGDAAFELVKSMEKYGEKPRLRSYGPALMCYCANSEAKKAYELEEHMVAAGVGAEEPEVAALLKVSAETGRREKVYEYLHKMRERVRGVSEATAEIIEGWFGGGGGGGGRLVCVDIDRAETENFAQSVASLALEREVQANFRDFQDWLDKHIEYEAIVDGANIGLYQQNFAEEQLDAVVKELYNRSNKWPLVVLHKKRIRTLLENLSNRELLEEWIAQGVVYATPYGSNDDWYWLYAAVKLKCLLVTNDEMRDHIFELLGRSFFLKWKERHQVRYTFEKGNLKLQMPPTYSVVIQESEKGTWHAPLAGDCSDESSRTWLCISRRPSHEASDGVPVAEDTSENRLNHHNFLKSCESKNFPTNNSLHCNSNSSQISDNKTTTITGKRKDRSSSPLET
ncbi:proteinaceous RNase P 2 [Actinidia rufa]|uniref:ribonuclease P n=1 Tax=Actinidia rufa TaxID=165716 RepID=A0A7J0HB77_9ERIC|nr:proteinaceous RNase P 2 [Actinidia rufa]